jgi:hypothetical protein
VRASIVLVAVIAVPAVGSVAANASSAGMNGEIAFVVGSAIWVNGALLAFIKVGRT